jgi:hypothetical protein
MPGATVSQRASGTLLTRSCSWQSESRAKAQYAYQRRTAKKAQREWPTRDWTTVERRPTLARMRHLSPPGDVSARFPSLYAAEAVRSSSIRI